MALTAYYVDSDIGTDTGAGTSGDPYGNIQHCLDTITRDSTNGDIIYGKGSETLGGALSFATYGTPSKADRLVLSRWDADWTLTAQNSSTAIIASAVSWVDYLDIIFDGNSCTTTSTIDAAINEFKGCTFRDSAYNSNNGMVNCSGNTTRIVGCSFDDMPYPLRIGGDCFIKGNDFRGYTGYIYLQGAHNRFIGNTVDASGGTGARGVYCTNDYNHISGNSFLGSASTVPLIDLSSSAQANTVSNNLCEGASGTGGKGIYIQAAGNVAYGNACYNNTTDYDLHANTTFQDDNESLGASPFAKSGSNTFANRGAYFAPVDTGNVWGS